MHFNNDNKIRKHMMKKSKLFHKTISARVTCLYTISLSQKYTISIMLNELIHFLLFQQNMPIKLPNIYVSSSCNLLVDRLVTLWVSNLLETEFLWCLGSNLVQTEECDSSRSNFQIKPHPSPMYNVNQRNENILRNRCFNCGPKTLI